MKHITLPSGKQAKIDDGKGYHLLQSQRKAKNTDEIPYALIAELAEIDGQKLPYEDILQMSLNDVSTLLNAINEASDDKPLGKSSQQNQSLSSAPQQTQHYQK
ncbi:MAG TPA: hypothetical protein P5556_00755 [Candidatus Gastranaerophilales bacterium]|nr:hypothetical protein [Candidatus Gastranaerophilales bacterium]